MEIKSFISLTRLVSSFNRWNKYLTGDRPSAGNYLMPLKNWHENVNLVGALTCGSFFNFLITLGKSTRNSGCEGKLFSATISQLSCPYGGPFYSFNLYLFFFFDVVWGKQKELKKKSTTKSPVGKQDICSTATRFHTVLAWSFLVCFMILPISTSLNNVWNSSCRKLSTTGWQRLYLCLDAVQTTNVRFRSAIRYQHWSNHIILY